MKKRLILTTMLAILSFAALPTEAKAASWIRSNNNWFYQRDNSGYVRNAWQNINNQWYSFDSSGVMRTGWFKDTNSKWYYLDVPNGNMRTGWVLVGNDWYYLDASQGGAMASNTTVDGRYYVDASGKWIENASSASGSNSISDYEREVVRLVNIERNNRGLASLTISDKLSRAADIRATELVSKTGHERPDGRQPWTAATEAGYKYSYIGENIAAGYVSPADVVDGWMNSDGHRRNILNSNFTEIGVGYFQKSGTDYGYYWVQLFGKPN